MKTRANDGLRCSGCVPRDPVAELLRLRHGPGAGLVGVASGKVVAAELLVRAVAPQQVPSDHEDRVGDGHGRLALADPTGQAPELGRVVRVAGPSGGSGGPDEDVEQTAVAGSPAAGAALAARHVVARRTARLRIFEAIAGTHKDLRLLFSCRAVP